MMMSDSVWLRARRALLPFHGVVGVGWGPKVARDKVVTQNAIIVLVEHKLPPAEISDAQINGRQWTSPTAEFKKPYAGSPSSIAGRK